MATYNFITETGVVIPDASAILTDVQQEFMEALGLPEIPDPSSAEGRMIDAEVTSRISVARNNALVANQLNPNLSTGVFLDSHLAFIGSRRDPAERSSADCLLAGVPGTPIPAGQFAEDENRNLWQFASSVTLDGTGQATATFQAVEFGPITADPNTITKIVSGVVGWETITNPSEAVPGKLEQSDISARRQRLLELGKNARSNSYAIIAAVSALEGVSGVRFLENFKSTTETLSNVELAPHSTWLCVEGGVDAQIAEAYYTSRTAGSGFNGDVTVNYTDPYSKQIIPVELNIECEHGDHRDQHLRDDAQNNVMIGIHDGSSSLAADAFLERRSSPERPSLRMRSASERSPKPSSSATARPAVNTTVVSPKVSKPR